MPTIMKLANSQWRWDSERKLFYDDIVHVLQSTIDSRLNSGTDIGLSQCLV